MKRTALFLAFLLSSTFIYAHGGMRELKGTIAKIGTESIVVTHTDGTTNETIALTKTTTYKAGNAPAAWSDMRVGSRVVVHFGHDGKALEIHLPQKSAS
jgi:hypothetical protein